MPIQLYIFDLDGTLASSFQDLANAVNQTFEQMGLPALTYEQVKSNVGQGARQMLKGCLRDAGADPDTSMERARELFFPIYQKNVAVYTKTYTGVIETLTELQNQNKTLAVCTNKPIDLAKPLIQKLGMSDFFQIILGGDSLPTKKPDPAPLQHIMTTLAFAPEETLMVGDSRFDVEAGKAAKTKTCGVTYGHFTAEEMAACQPDCIIDNFPDLLQYNSK